MILITLNQIKAYDPCAEGWNAILSAKGNLGMETPFPLADAFDSNSFDDVLWSLRCLPEHDALWRKFAVWCARQVQRLMEDKRSIDALDVAWRHVCGAATDEDLAAAWAAARDAAGAAAWAAARDAAGAAAWDAAGAAAWAVARAAAGAAARDAAGAAAGDAARDAAGAAARAAAWAAARAAAGDAARDAAGAAAWAAARAAARDAQAEKLKQILIAVEWVE